MANFVRIGTRVINLELVSDIHLTVSAGSSSNLKAVVIDFPGVDVGLCVFQAAEPEAYALLVKWMDSQPALIEE